MAFNAGERITADRLNQEIGPAEPWTNVVLQNGWTAWGGGYGVPGLRLHTGNVELRGTLRAGTRTDGTVLFTLPAGYRPGWTQQIMVRSEAPGNTFVEIDPTSGNVALWNAGTTNAIGIDGLYFARS